MVMMLYLVSSENFLMIFGVLVGSVLSHVIPHYDQSYPVINNNYLGTHVEKLQFPACSGDQTWQIYDQAKELEDNIDLLTLTAGGNDLCLADIIKSCIILPFWGEVSCTAVLDKAEKNLKDIMRSNIKQILLALKDKMAKDGIVRTRIAPKNRTGLSLPGSRTSSPTYSYYFEITVDRRKRFSKLAEGLNNLIGEVVKYSQDEVDYTIGMSNWDLWGIEGVKGQMCDPTSTGAYPDSEQHDLLFFKPDTRRPRILNSLDSLSNKHDLANQNQGAANIESRGLKNLDNAETLPLRTKLRLPPRDLDENGVDRAVYKSSLWNSVNPRAAILKDLDINAPSLPGCPGDSEGPLGALGNFLLDFFGRLFHPNELGHNAVASFAIQMTMSLRAKVLGVAQEVCELTEELKCWQKEGKKGYVTADRLDENYKKFCDDVESPEDGLGDWRFAKSYHAGTPDEHELVYEVGEGEAGFNKDDCLKPFKRIIHGCDGNDPENPLNWKFDGTWKRNEFTYTVNVKRTNRPWPPIKKPYGSCVGKYFGSHSAFVIRGMNPFSPFSLFSLMNFIGAGWSSWDEGRETLLPAIKSCLGAGVMAWTWVSLDKPDEDGMEWWVGFNTPIWVAARCFRNKAAFAAKGFTDGCDAGVLV
ncbi:hypothetical protein FQN49_003275 [Arthroderma sp. PD_2]|nr:hypothetical protein FQN49_003275 [Arthroderma sp. PD_2]